MRMRLRALAAGTTVALVAVAGVHAAPAALAAKTITVWSDAAHAPVIEKLTQDGYEGYSFVVVVKDPATVGADLAEATPATAPDVLWGDLAATGQLAEAGTIVPVKMTKKNRALFRPNVLDASNVGEDRYGIPVQISNLALVTNTALVPKQPATFSELSAIALDLQKKKKAKIPFAVGQGPGSNGVNLYPLFSSLGGYIFGRGADGSLDPTDVGLMNPTFRKNASQIDKWNASGLIDSSLTPDRARTAFVKGRSAFWLAGPEDLDTLLKLGFVYRIGAVPPAVAGTKAAPLLTVHGFMVTKYAEVHGVAEPASKWVSRAMTRAGSQLALAGASGWFPANTAAAGQVGTGSGRIRAIGNAGVDGVAMPNIPQAAAAWAPYGTAWSVSTAGGAATPAVKAFRIAKRAVVAAATG
jgi:arabinogalactan oligomer / maltooligosaccharide transport system substrate-binding protein